MLSEIISESNIIKDLKTPEVSGRDKEKVKK